MRLHRLERVQRFSLPPDEVFPFFADARNLEAITPPWLKFRIESAGQIDMRAGTLIDYRLSIRRIPVRWRTRIEVWEPDKRFVDRQLSGPYRLWHHTHEFEPDGEGTVMRDLVRYALPLGPLGGLAHLALVRRDLAAIFDFRRVEIARRLGELAPVPVTS